MLKVAMLSKWHVHARDYARQINENPRAQVTCVWDENAQRGKEWANELGVPFYAGLSDALANSDAVCVDTPTSMHREVITAAARAGKHVFTEKVLAFTVKEATEIADEVKKAGVKFCISFPQRTFPVMLYVKQAVDSGALGDITLMRARNVHGGALLNRLPEYWYDPATTGGGAMMDLGAHPMYLSSWILGKPRRFSSAFSNFTPRAVEDHAVSLIEFESGAVSVVETSLVNPYSKRMLEVYGTKGAVLCENDQVQVLTQDNGPIQGWVTPSALPKALPMPIELWVNGIMDGTEIPFGLTEAIALTELMEGAYKASKA